MLLDGVVKDNESRIDQLFYTTKHSRLSTDGLDCKISIKGSQMHQCWCNVCLAVSFCQYLVRI